MKRVTVIVPAFRDDDGLGVCVEALRKQTYPSELIEIICVDNTPDFELLDKRSEFAPAGVLHEPRPGSYSARNRGIAEAGGEILAFTDADCLPCPEWIEEGVRALGHHPEGALLVGRIEVFARDPQRPTAVELFEIGQAFPQQRYAEVHRFGATANVFVPRRVIEVAGPFDARLASGGDREFGNRVHAAGFPIVYSEKATVRHPARRNLSALFGKTRRIALGDHDKERIGLLPKGSFVRGFLRDLRPPVQTCWGLLRNRRLGNLSGRLKAAGVMIVWRYHRAACRLKLMVRI